MKLPTELFHYSKEKDIHLIDSYNDNLKSHCPDEASMKPSGLWFSVEDYGPDDFNWREWCIQEQFRLEDLKYKHTLTIAKDARILYLRTEKEVTEFGFKYAARDPFGFASEGIFKNGGRYIYILNWVKVKEEYDGIIIAPYQRGCRFGSGTTWYYPWDCSSGCIWNYDMVKLELQSILDIKSLKKTEDFPEEGNATDSLLASLAQSK